VEECTEPPTIDMYHIMSLSMALLTFILERMSKRPELCKKL
jgi:hypothetical protein